MKKRTVIVIAAIIIIIFVAFVPRFLFLQSPESSNVYIIENDIRNSEYVEETRNEFGVIKAFPKLQFKNPIFLTHANDESNLIFVASQTGIVEYFSNDEDVSSSEIFLNVQEKVFFGGEMGLLGFVFDPDYRNNGYFYISYTDLSHNSVISRFSSDPTTREVDHKSELKILEVMQPYSNHNGGHIMFGSDGYLYIGLGDGGAAGDPENNGQNGKTLLGSILRIDVSKISHDKKYSIPSDNPFIESQNVRDEIWAYGLRNPWRFSLDIKTDMIIAGDVGQNNYEEIDFIEKGKNYGWNKMEGNNCYPSSIVNCEDYSFQLPVLEYSHNLGCSITGGYVYRGQQLKDLQGLYVFTDFCNGEIWAVDIYSDDPSFYTITKGIQQISSFGLDENNELFMLSFDGYVYKIIQNNK